MSVALRVFPLANLLNRIDFVKPGMSEVLELEKQMSALEVGNHQYFLNQLVAKIRNIIEEDTGKEDYYGYSFFTKGEMQDYGQKPIEWFQKSFKQDDFTCEIIRSVFRGKMDIEWEIQKA